MITFSEKQGKSKLGKISLIIGLLVTMSVFCISALPELPEHIYGTKYPEGEDTNTSM